MRTAYCRCLFTQVLFSLVMLNGHARARFCPPARLKPIARLARARKNSNGQLPVCPLPQSHCPGSPRAQTGTRFYHIKARKRTISQVFMFRIQVGIILVQKFILEHDFSKSVTHVSFLTKVVHTFCHFCPLKQFLAMPV